MYKDVEIYLHLYSRGTRLMLTIFKKLWSDESGISSVEYALLLAFVAAAILGAAEILSNAVENSMTDAAECIEGIRCDDGDPFAP